ncbi:MAG: hypothetical protein KAY21_05245 [Limnohabitans sp.]|nr:hypothetical protein [Limnohabitans sp.]
MNIHQLSVSFDERQDRLLLRLNTQDSQEFRFWLTRRMTARLLPVIEQSVGRLEASQPGMTAPDSSSQQILTQLKRDAFLQKADFSTPFAAQAQRLPLGPAPLLVTDAQFNFQPGGALQIQFQEKSADAPSKTCQLNLQAQLVHGLVHLILQALPLANWALPTGIPAETNMATPAEAEPDKPRYAH